MEMLLAVVKSGSFRRIVAAVVSLGVVALNRKFGLGLQAEEIAGVVVLAVTYLLQSASKEKALGVAAKAGEAAAAALPVSVGVGAGAVKASELAK